MFYKQKRLIRKLFKSIGNQITHAVDFFYPPFRRFVDIRLYRYAATGVANLALDSILFFVVFHFVLQKQMLHLGPITLSSHIASLFMVIPITFLTGFFLQKYVTFSASKLKGRTQIMRYLSVVLANILLNYIGLKLLVDFFNFYPTPSKLIMTIVTVIFSYLSQKKYTFRIRKHD